MILLALAFLCASCASSFDVTVSHPFEVTTFRKSYANTHLVKISDDKYLMIDAGSADNAETLDADLRNHGIKPEWIRLLILTHGHWDHAGGAAYFQERYKIPVIVGSGDQNLLVQGHSDPLCPTGMIARLRHSGDLHRAFIGPKPDVVVNQDLPLDQWFGPGVGRVMSVPAHTTGSLAVIVGNAVFVGDLFRGAMLTTEATTHFYMCDVPGAKRMIQELLTVKAPAAELFFPGHFGPSIARSEVEVYARGPH
jgi:glyoxylase-like metal-dependent hydrolase (beta-lactamase superfamily II)